MTRALRASMVALVAIALVGLSGCASSGGGNAEPVAKAPVPSSSPLAKIEPGMTDMQVRKLLGDPDNARSYMTGKAWIPFYFGGDTHRVDWVYSGVGRVVFTRNRWSGSVTVLDRVHDPAQ